MDSFVSGGLDSVSKSQPAAWHKGSSQSRALRQCNAMWLVWNMHGTCMITAVRATAESWLLGYYPVHCSLFLGQNCQMQQEHATETREINTNYNSLHQLTALVRATPWPWKRLSSK